MMNCSMRSWRRWAMLWGLAPIYRGATIQWVNGKLLLHWGATNLHPAALAKMSVNLQSLSLRQHQGREPSAGRGECRSEEEIVGQEEVEVHNQRDADQPQTARVTLKTGPAKQEMYIVSNATNGLLTQSLSIYNRRFFVLLTVPPAILCIRTSWHNFK